MRGIEAVQVSKVDALQKASVTIYDYYEPGETFFWSFQLLSFKLNLKLKFFL
jgi:hypothetical protein